MDHHHADLSWMDNFDEEDQEIQAFFRGLASESDFDDGDALEFGPAAQIGGFITATTDVDMDPITAFDPLPGLIPLTAVNSTASNGNRDDHLDHHQSGVTDDDDDADNDDYHSMPSLHSLSDSSSDASSIMHGLDPHAYDEEMEGHTHDPSNVLTDLPELIPIEPPQRRGYRRARDDDEDEDRDRRHPSQRSTSTSTPTMRAGAAQGPTMMTMFERLAGHASGRGAAANPSPSANAEPFIHPRTPSNPAQQQPLPPQPQPQQQQPPQSQQQPQRMHVMSGIMTLTLDQDGRVVAPLGPTLFFPPTNGNGPAALNLAELFQASMREPPDDPVRAKRLVRALEEVPVGLVRRMERFQDSGREDGTVGCAICWDSLLDPESGGFGEAEKSAPQDAEPEASSSSTSNAPNRTPPKIVSLPCAHVFHESCLIPWFSRPKSTTCPTCRFNIDPDNLTYVRRPVHLSPSTAAPAPPASASAPPASTSEPSTSTSEPSTSIPVPSTSTPTPPASTSEPSTFPPAPSTSTSVPFLSTSAPSQNPQRAQSGPQPPSTLPPGPTPPVPQQDPNARPPLPWGAFAGAHVVIPPFVMAGVLSGLGPGRQAQATQPPAATARPQPNDQNAAQPRGPVPGPTTQPSSQNSHPQATEPSEPDIPPPPLEHAHPNAFLQHILGASMNVFLDALANSEIPLAAMNLPTAGQEGNGNALNAEAGTNSSGASNDGTSSENSNPSTGINDAAGEGEGPQPVPFHEFFSVNINIPGVGPPPMGPPPMHAHAPPPMRRQRRQWTLPPAPGPSLRQRIEEKEREAGLRCFDTSCGFGPFDDDDADGIQMVRQLLIQPGKGSPASAGTSVCGHTFHPGCLVSAERVAGWGDVSRIKEAGGVEVACPVCRAVGCVSKEDWDEGVQALDNGV